MVVVVTASDSELVELEFSSGSELEELDEHGVVVVVVVVGINVVDPYAFNVYGVVTT